MTDHAIHLQSENGPLFYQIYDYFKTEIDEGHLAPGVLLPSIRKCAESLRVSKNTVEVAYQLLQSEGYVDNIPRKGYKVLERSLTAAPSALPEIAQWDSAHPIVYDFRYGNCKLSDFPFANWNRLRNELIHGCMDEYSVVGDSQGEAVLRQEILHLLHSSRGIAATPEQIVIGATPQQLVTLICQILNRDTSIIAVENPGYDGSRNTFINYGFTVKGIPLTDNGMEMEDLRSSSANIAYVSPSQQFIHKMVMPLSKRRELVQWLQKASYLIEDDYEWEFKYDEHPIPSIHSLDSTGKVLYLGSISKALLPVFNLGYMVLPPSLVPVFKERMPEYDQPVSVIDQLTFGQFLQTGYWFRHVQRMRKNYARKRELFFQAVTEYMGHHVVMRGKDSGLHLFLTVRTERSEEELIDAALRAGIRVYETSRYWFRDPASYPTVLLGYGAMEEKQIKDGIQRLAKAWFS